MVEVKDNTSEFKNKDVDDKEVNIEPSKPEEKPEGHIGSMEVDGVEHKIINSVTLIEIRIHKLENNREATQVIAEEFMMTDYKKYMIIHLTEAINIVMNAKRRNNVLKLSSGILKQKFRNFWKNRRK